MAWGPLSPQRGVLFKKKRGLSKNPRITLAEIGVDKNLAHEARKFAALPEEKFEALVDRLAALEASMNIDVGRDFLDIAGGFKDRDCRCYVCKIGASLRESLFIVRDCSYDFRSL